MKFPQSLSVVRCRVFLRIPRWCSDACNFRNCPAIPGEVWWWYWSDCVRGHWQWSGTISVSFNLSMRAFFALGFCRFFLKF